VADTYSFRADYIFPPINYGLPDRASGRDGNRYYQYVFRMVGDPLDRTCLVGLSPTKITAPSNKQALHILLRASSSSRNKVQKLSFTSDLVRLGLAISLIKPLRHRPSEPSSARQAFPNTAYPARCAPPAHRRARGPVAPVLDRPITLTASVLLGPSSRRQLTKILGYDPV
jgi:hypothetical protein